MSKRKLKDTILKRKHLKKDNYGNESSEKGQLCTGKSEKDTSGKELQKKYNSGKDKSEKGQF